MWFFSVYTEQLQGPGQYELVLDLSFSLDPDSVPDVFCWDVQPLFLSVPKTEESAMRHDTFFLGVYYILGSIFVLRLAIY